MIQTELWEAIDAITLKSTGLTLATLRANYRWFQVAVSPSPAPLPTLSLSDVLKAITEFAL